MKSSDSRFGKTKPFDASLNISTRNFVRRGEGDYLRNGSGKFFHGTMIMEQTYDVSIVRPSSSQTRNFVCDEEIDVPSIRTRRIVTRFARPKRRIFDSSFRYHATRLPSQFDPTLRNNYSTKMPRSKRIISRETETPSPSPTVSHNSRLKEIDREISNGPKRNGSGMNCSELDSFLKKAGKRKRPPPWTQSRRRCKR